MTSVWEQDPDTPIPAYNANSNVKSQEFTATAGQTSFTLTDYIYAPDTGSLQIFVNGVKQQATEVAETSTTVFVLSQACEAGDLVEAVAQTAITSSVIPFNDPATLALLAAATGALLVGIQDSGAYIAGSTVEAALQEAFAALALKAPKAAPALTGAATLDGDPLATTVALTAALPRYYQANFLHNGEFANWQRATTQQATSTYAVGSADRFAFRGDNTAGNVTRQAANDPAVSSREFCARIGRGSGTTTTTWGIRQALTTAKTRALLNQSGGKSLKLLLYMRSGAHIPVAGFEIDVKVYTGTGTDQTTATMSTWTGVAELLSGVGNFTIGPSSPWTLYSIPVSVPSGVTQLGFQIEWANAIGASLGADDYLYISAAALVDSTTLAADTLPYVDPALDLIHCQRHYQKLNSVWVFANPARATLIINMRATPTITGGGAGFSSAGTDLKTMNCGQTTAATANLTLDADI